MEDVKKFSGQVDASYQTSSEKMLGLGDLTAKAFLEKATEFSAAFQKKMEEQQIYTGNQNVKDLVGMRLKRLNSQFALDLLDQDRKKANEKYGKIQEVLGIDINKIVSEARPSGKTKQAIIEFFEGNTHHDRLLSYLI